MTSRIGRRQFISALGGVAVVWPRAGLAQQSAVRRIAVLEAESMEDAQVKAEFAGFRNALARLSWIEDRTIQIDYLLKRK